MKLDAKSIERDIDRRLHELRDQLHTQVSKDGTLTEEVAGAYMRAAYGKGYVHGLEEDDPPPFAAAAESLLRSRASLAGSRARHRRAP